MSGLAARGLRPVAELGARRQHGERLRYLAGCRCLKCRMANSNYETARAKARKAGDWNGIVDAEPARAHVRWLKRVGVGRRMIAAASDVAVTVIHEIAMGRKLRIRARTARRILAVTPACRGDNALVSGAQTWRLIDSLLDEGFTKRRIARELGMRSPALQIRKHRVTARTAHRIAALHRRYAA